MLVLNRSFWPDIEATGQFLTELCAKLAGTYKVTAVVGRSYYTDKDFKFGRFYRKERFGQIEILRIRHTKFWKKNLIGRFINWLTYAALSFFAVLRTRADLIIACTDPPFLGLIAAVLSRIKSVPFIINCRDLYPDVALGLGKLRPGMISRTFDYLNRKSFDRAHCIVCIGTSMKNRLKKKGLRHRLIKVIPDWADTRSIRPVAREDNLFLNKIGARDKFIIMYSGNLGFSQKFTAVFKALTLLKKQIPFYAVIIGDGVMKSELKAEARSLGLKDISFFPYQPRADLSFSLSAADLHLLPLKSGMDGAMVPSKLYGIMAAGRPYLAITDEGSEPARLAEETGCGIWVQPDDIEAIARKLEWAFKRRDVLSQMGETGRRIAEERFDKEVVIAEWFDLLEEYV